MAPVNPAPTTLFSFPSRLAPNMAHPFVFSLPSLSEHLPERASPPSSSLRPSVPYPECRNADLSACPHPRPNSSLRFRPSQQPPSPEQYSNSPACHTSPIICGSTLRVRLLSVDRRQAAHLFSPDSARPLSCAQVMIISTDICSALLSFPALVPQRNAPESVDFTSPRPPVRLRTLCTIVCRRPSPSPV